MSTNLGLDCQRQVGLNVYKAGGRRRSFELKRSPQFLTVFVASLVCSLVIVILSQTHTCTCAQSAVYQHQSVTVITPVPGGETSNLCCSHRSVIALEDFFAKGLEFRTRYFAYEGV